MSGYTLLEAGNDKFVKMWDHGVTIEPEAIEQLKACAQLPFIFHNTVIAMPDAHAGWGSTVGTVLPTQGAVVPSAVGVDIGCGMIAVPTSLNREELRGKEAAIRADIERVCPNGRTNNGGPGDRGAWHNVPLNNKQAWDEIAPRYEDLLEKHPGARARNTMNHLGTLGTGNHFIELSSNPQGRVYIVLHSGSRGLGWKIGDYFSRLAQSLCERWFIPLPNRDLAYLPAGTDEYRDYLEAVQIAQDFAWRNRLLMSHAVLDVLEYNLGRRVICAPAIHCHHNYIAEERHYGQNVWVTRKGAVRSQADDLGIIPGSMGARTYIVRGLGNRESLCTCSHGAGRTMSRTQAEKVITLEQHIKATEGVECLKDASVLDESPAAYKDIDAVMMAQSDLVEPIDVVKQFICVKGPKSERRKRSTERMVEH